MCGHNDKPQKAQHSQSCGVLRIGPLFACMNGHGGSTSGRRRILPWKTTSGYGFQTSGGVLKLERLISMASWRVPLSPVVVPR
jgi:hypothetical protein